jgi:hypothetical protein
MASSVTSPMNSAVAFLGDAHQAGAQCAHSVSLPLWRQWRCPAIVAVVDRGLAVTDVHMAIAAWDDLVPPVIPSDVAPVFFANLFDRHKINPSFPGWGIPLQPAKAVIFQTWDLSTPRPAHGCANI